MQFDTPHSPVPRQTVCLASIPLTSLYYRSKTKNCSDHSLPL